MTLRFKAEAGQSMLNIEILCDGNLKEKYLRDGCAEYMKRIGAYAKISVKEVRDEKQMLASISQRAFKIALCIEGKMLDSKELADKIDSLAVSGVSEITFIIGGSDGLPEEIKAMCDLRLSFSRMTFPHQLMRMILLEQIYRAFTIINNGKYHK